MRRPGQQALLIVPVTFRQACAYVAEHHRHHKPPRGMKFCLGVRPLCADYLCGVAFVGRPSARALQNEWTAEVIRTCTNGEPNANSMLYGAAWRAAAAMGYQRLVTYTEENESGASLKAAGFHLAAILPPRDNWHDSSQKLRGLRDPDGRGGVLRFRWEIGPASAPAARLPT